MNRTTTAAAVVAVAVFLMGGSPTGAARAQEPATPVAAPQVRPERYLRLDLFVGGASHWVKDPPKDENGEVEPGWMRTSWRSGCSHTLSPESRVSLAERRLRPAGSSY